MFQCINIFPAKNHMFFPWYLLVDYILVCGTGLMFLCPCWFPKDSAVSSHAKKTMPVSRVATKLVWMLVHDVIDWCPLQVMTPFAPSVPGSWFTNTLTKIENELCMDCTNGLYKWITLIVVQKQCKLQDFRDEARMLSRFCDCFNPCKPNMNTWATWQILMMNYHYVNSFNPPFFPKSQSMDISALSGIRLYLIFFQFPLYPCYL